MPLTTSLYTGLTGMQTNSQMLDVVGNNIANVNTTAFKRSFIQFETQISDTIKNASQPGDNLGGTNPAQVGLGTRLAAIRRDFNDGGLQPTGIATDMAIEGNGFFIVDQGGFRRFTRAGNFTLDRDFNLVTNSGGFVQGYGVDEDFNVVDGVLGPINIPIGVLTIAEPTEEVIFAGNLNAGGDESTLGSIINSQALYSDAAATTAATGATLLSSVFDATGTQLFADGDVISLTGATVGGATIPDTTFTVSATAPADGTASGTTVNEFLTWLDDVLGIDSSQAVGGITIDATGAINITGNTGSDHDILIENGNIIVNQGTAPTLPFQMTKTQSANGETARTSFVIFDTLGNPLTIDMTFALEDKNDTGTQWRFYARSLDDTDSDTFMSTGILNFDNDGQLVSQINGSFTINRDETGALNPQTVRLKLEDPFGAVSALFDTRSQVNAIGQDGSGLGTLEDFSVSEDGTITGVFSNSLLRTLGQVPVSLFSNPEGLLETGGSLFQPTPNSGDPIIVQATSSGSGRIIGRSLELANVELSEEFINLISASTGFSANSRIITTSERLIQELLATLR